MTETEGRDDIVDGSVIRDGDDVTLFYTLEDGSMWKVRFRRVSEELDTQSM